ncbi:MAG TPA: hypothetical protein VLG69_03710 [Candidatus Andersenbacteria bacterium]|nr:hypothetical protein [Candidatus Andersenbacteria bacterium]
MEPITTQDPTLAQPSSNKKMIWMVVGSIVLIILIIVFVSMYGGLIKTQTNGSSQYSETGNLKTDSLASGQYRLDFLGENSAGVNATSSTTFNILGTNIPPY